MKSAFSLLPASVPVFTDLWVGGKGVCGLFFIFALPQGL